MSYQHLFLNRISYSKFINFHVNYICDLIPVSLSLPLDIQDGELEGLSPWNTPLVLQELQETRRGALIYLP